MRTPDADNQEGNQYIGVINAQLAVYESITGQKLHEWMRSLELEQIEKQINNPANQGRTTTANRHDTLLPAGVLDQEAGSSMQEAAAAEAELKAMSTAEATDSDAPAKQIAALAALDFGNDERLIISSLYDALTAAQLAIQEPEHPAHDSTSQIDPIFKENSPNLATGKLINIPKMNQYDGKYRAHQLELLTASNPAALYEVILRRREDCWRSLSPAYLANRLFFIKLWLFITIDMLEISPWRAWGQGASPTFEDGIMETYILFCSKRFVTWGSVMAAKTHVIEFMRSMFGVTPPEFPNTTYTAQKLKKTMGKERPGGRRTRTGFTVDEVKNMFKTALSWVTAEADPAQQKLLINYIAACGTVYERAYRAGNVIPKRWNHRDHLSRATIRDLCRTTDEIRQLVDQKCVAVLFDSPMQKNSHHAGEVARQMAAKPAIVDLTSRAPFAMAVLIPMLHEIDGDVADPKSTPAFRDLNGECLSQKNLRRFVVTMAASAGIDTDRRGIGSHSLRIARRAAYAAGMKSSDYADIFEEARLQADQAAMSAALNERTGHTSAGGAAPYDRAEIARSLAADRAAANAVMAPVEILFQHSADRSRGQSIVVRQNTDGSFSAVDDTDELANHDVATTDEDTDEEEQAEEEGRGPAQPKTQHVDAAASASSIDGPIQTPRPGAPLRQMAPGKIAPLRHGIKHSDEEDDPSSPDSQSSEDGGSITGPQRSQTDTSPPCTQNDLPTAKRPRSEEGSPTQGPASKFDFAPATCSQRKTDISSTDEIHHGTEYNFAQPIWSQHKLAALADSGMQHSHRHNIRLAQWRHDTTVDKSSWWIPTRHIYDIDAFATDKWAPAVQVLVQRRADKASRSCSQAQLQRYMSKSTLRNSLLAIGAPAAVSITRRVTHEQNETHDKQWAEWIIRSLTLARQSPLASNAFVKAIVGASYLCDDRVDTLSKVSANQQQDKRQTTHTEFTAADDEQFPSRLLATPHSEPATNTVTHRRQDASHGDQSKVIPRPTVLGGDRDQGTRQAPADSKRTYTGITPTFDTAREQAALRALQPAAPDGGPPTADWIANRQFRFRLGPCVALPDGSGVCSHWTLHGNAPDPAAATIFQNVRLESTIYLPGSTAPGADHTPQISDEQHHVKRFYCEAWELNAQRWCAPDYNIVLGPDDERAFDYHLTSMAWLEPGDMPAELTVGTDSEGIIEEVWGWADGHEGWRSPPAGTPVMVRSIRMQKQTGGSLQFWEERKYGMWDMFPAGTALVPQWSPPPMTPVPHAMSIFAATTAPHAAQWAFQSVTQPRPNANPMQLGFCRTVPPTHRALGHCGHPGCTRLADIQGLNRVCDGCGAHDPECMKFCCEGCLQGAARIPGNTRSED